MSVINAYLPPLTIFCTVIDPACAEQISSYEILIFAVVTCCPLVTLFAIINIGAVCLVFPAVFLAVIEYRAFTGAFTFPCAEYGFAEIIDFDEFNIILLYYGIGIL